MSEITQEETQWYSELTPSGIEVRYSPAPKRMYQVRCKGLTKDFEVPDDQTYNWREVPSVTTVLGVLDKPALPWWGMKVGVEGLLELWKRGKFFWDEEVGLTTKVIEMYDPPLTREIEVDASPENCVQSLTDFRLTVNHQRDKAGDRGTRVHAAFEDWAKTERIPNPDDFSEEDAGYVRGLVRFLEEVQPRPRACEVMVGSLRHGYAGRYDLRAVVERRRSVVFKRTKSGRESVAELHPGTLLIDLKTSKGVYPTHSLQLEAYEAASIECGYEPTNARGILQVSDDGGYQFVRSVADFQGFKHVLDTYNYLEGMKRRKRK